MTDMMFRPERNDGRTVSFWRRVLTATLIVLSVILLIQLAFNAAEVLLLLFISLLLAILIRTASNWLRDHTALSDKAALAVVLLGVLLAFVLLGVFIGPRVADQVSQFTEQLPQAVEQLESQLEQYEWGRQLLNNLPRVRDLDGMISQGDIGIFGRITTLISGVFEALGVLLVVVFTAVYLAVEPGMYVDNFVRLFPAQRRERVREILRESYRMLQLWLFTRLVSMVVNGVLTFIGLMLIGLPFALPLALIDALLSFVPTFGPILALIPALLIAILQGPQTVLLVLLVYLTVEGVDNYIVSPLLERFALYIPPAVIVGGQLVLLVLVGRIGLFVAAPLIAAGIVIIRMVYVEGTLPEMEESIEERGEG